MQLEEFHGCCGVGIVYDLNNLDFSSYDDFGYYDDNDDSNDDLYEDGVKPPTPTAWQNMYKQAMNYHYGLLLATTVSDQKRAIKSLEQEQFVPLLTFKNPNTHGTVVTLWLRILTKKGKTLFDLDSFVKTMGVALSEAKKSDATTGEVVAKQKNKGNQKKKARLAA